MTASERFHASLQGPKPLLLDGPMGTQLLASGFHVERDLRGSELGLVALNLTRSDQVQAVHESYLEHGARALRTHTFAAHREQLGPLDLTEDGARVHAAAMLAAREAAEFWCEEGAPPAFLLGTLGPSVEPGADPGRLASSAEGIREQVRWLADDCEALLFETFSDVPTLEAALGAARSEAPDLPIAVSVTTNSEGKLYGLGDLKAVADVAQRNSVGLLAVNCGAGSRALSVPLEQLRDYWSGPLGAWPNVGTAESLETPQEFADSLTAIASRLDLRAIGACCGALPAHLAALSCALDLPLPRNPLDS